MAQPRSNPKSKGWVGVDLDSTLAYYDKWRGAYQIGAPIPAMVDLVKKMLAEGKDVRIFTARASDRDPKTIQAIHMWCQNVFGRILPVTNCKDHQLYRYYDDKAVSVEKNTGRMLDANEGRVKP